MAAITNKPLLLLFLPLLFSIPLLLPSSGSEDGCTINGQIRVPRGDKTFGRSSNSNVKVVLNGGQSITFLKPDGNFSFHNVPSGSHLIEVVAIGFFFSPVWINVEARNCRVEAALTHKKEVLSELVLQPLRRERYYQIGRPFSIMSVVKTPMGTIVGLMLILVVLMSNLMEKMAPEELQRAKEEMKNERASSFLSILLSNFWRRQII